MSRASPHMSLGQHLDELRRRLIFALLGLLPIFVVALAFGERVISFLLLPAQRLLLKNHLPDTFLSTGPLETFNTYFYVSIVITITVGAPWVLYQIWKFVAPGLYERERRFVYILIPLSSALVLASVFFLFRVALPMVLGFLVNFGTDIGAHPTPVAEPPAGVVFAHIPILDADPPAPVPGDAWINREHGEVRICMDVKDGKPDIRSVQALKSLGVRPEYRVSEYTKLIISLALAFAGGFQMPVVVLLLGWANIVTPQFLRKYRRHAFLICAIAAALLTPGDLWSMFSMLAPLYLLFELGILLLVLFPAKRIAAGLTAGQREREEERKRAAEGADSAQRDEPRALLPDRPDTPLPPQSPTDEG